MIESTAHDFSKSFSSHDLDTKLLPINKAVDDMLTRLEEFETLVNFAKNDVKDSNDLLTSTLHYKKEFNDLCSKVDTVEFLIAHIKNNLENLEENIEKAEKKFGITDNSVTVTSILSPFFKKNVERNHSISTSELFKSEDYFQ